MPELLDTLEPREPADIAVELVWRAAFAPPRELGKATIVVREALP